MVVVLLLYAPAAANPGKQHTTQDGGAHNTGGDVPRPEAILYNTVLRCFTCHWTVSRTGYLARLHVERGTPCLGGLHNKTQPAFQGKEYSRLLRKITDIGTVACTRRDCERIVTLPDVQYTCRRQCQCHPGSTQSAGHNYGTNQLLIHSISALLPQNELHAWMIVCLHGVSWSSNRFGTVQATHTTPAFHTPECSLLARSEHVYITCFKWSILWVGYISLKGTQETHILNQ